VNFFGNTVYNITLHARMLINRQWVWIHFYTKVKH